MGDWGLLALGLLGDLLLQWQDLHPASCCYSALETAKQIVAIMQSLLVDMYEGISPWKHLICFVALWH